jgi:hypothetical protein
VPYQFSFLTQELSIDNKADTLTQLQLTRDPAKDKFLASQIPELKGLQDMDVLDIYQIPPLKHDYVSMLPTPYLGGITGRTMPKWSAGKPYVY